ncbi:hypothetical protein SAMN04488074_110161 [Lentzea albidocapillata subsp. violacea]|uniref:Glyoxalase-like domain-containing protein n=1 Tax=Lentzea albidocapillata subsp. violacea TaxID=128104 RepID=A0A1G9J7Z8_9PSEU|nr:hypothetical protein [Lentzea albidocapillata]SDL33343.1 hypothetical protein SAMN04488074_110161 [Lentzea albidocapillata subsp. violacea]
MANELTIPLLPCVDIDEMSAFYEMLGFSITYRQTRPNPYVCVRREDINLHFYGMDGHVPEQSHSTCVIIVEDTGPLFEDFAARMRAVHGKLLISGIPRMTRPRLRNDRYTGFTVVDPGGNWIRINKATQEPEARTKLAKAMENAARLADAKGDERQGLKILEGALTKTDGSEPELAEAQAYRDELVERIKGSEPRPGA